MCALGLPGWWYVTTRDPDERVTLQAMLEHARAERSQQTRELVHELVTALLGK